MGQKHSAKTKRLMSKLASGKGNPFYGRKHSSSSKQKISRGVKGKKNPMYGRHHSAAAKQKMRLARLKAAGKRK